MDFQNIINKWNYNEELSEFLKKVYNSLIEELGSDFEPIIYEAFLNTEVILSGNNIYDCLKNRGLLEEEDDYTVSYSDLKRASGVYHCYPNIIFNGTDFEISSVTRVVVINSTTIEEDYIKAALIHELGHMVKGYYQEFSIEGNRLITRSGLIETIEELYIENGKVKKRLISEKGVGIEEGLNAALEESIAKKIVNQNYKVSGYGVINVMAKTLSEDLELKSIILPAQMLKEKKNLIKEIDAHLKDGAYLIIEDIMDRIYKLTLKAFSEIFEPNKM